ncbi:ATP-binding protein [Methylomicrobium sp. RS1]|jgi:two-component system NtrC family sensor kinase|uniref:ATP-binding protein n=1 Tax=Candidatus Methylomicrobium oryzae TaxID=2802053 RepID=UPI001922BEEE|nr:ATP-binding protein [Methylomicrobium sp. RS1]MBL1264721.1 GAF domain-containing protein [Methylomicrobium sp. RS1]
MTLIEAPQLNWIHDLYRLGQADLLQNTTHEIFERILRHIVQGFKADTGSLALYQGEPDSKLCIVASIGLPAECLGSVIAPGSGIIGWVAESGKPVVLQGDISDDPRFNQASRAKRAFLPLSALCWPLRLDDTIIGALSVNKLHGQTRYTESDLELGLVLVNLISLVIDNARLHREKQERLEQSTVLNNHYLQLNQQLETTRQCLEHSEKRLHDTLNSLDSVVWSIMPDTFTPLYLNQVANEIFGYPAADFFARPTLWWDIIYSDDRKNVKNCLEQLKNTKVQKITYRIVHSTNQLRWLSTHMRYIPKSQDMSARIDGITVDITQYQQATELLKKQNRETQAALKQLQEVQEKLVQSEKLASVGQLAAGVAHEINNPIGYINSNLTSLQTYVNDLLTLVAFYEKAEAFPDNSEQFAQISAFKQQIDFDFLKNDVLDLLEESQEGATRVKKIVQDLKDFSRFGGEDDWQWTNLHAGLNSTLNIVNNEIKYKAKVVKEFGDLPEVRCLPHQLNQVFMNLLVNAAHAIEHEGTITLRTGTENDQVWIEISDTGQGIAPEHQNKIFDPFFTTKPVGKGTGLGLSVSYSIVKKHQGEIHVCSQLGQGTTFRIALPVAGALVENVQDASDFD